MYRLLTLCLALLATTTSSAAIHCVSTASALRTVLATAKSNGEADEIRIRSGVYYATPAAPFDLLLDEPHGLKISGGWTGPYTVCLSTTGNANLTVLDGSNSTMALRIRVLVPHVVVPVSVEGLMLRNGRSPGGNVDDAAGLAISGFADGAAFITVDRIIAQNNIGTIYAPAVHLGSDHNFVRFTNSIVRSNQTEQVGAVVVMSNAGGSALHNLSVLFNHRTTPHGALDWWGNAPGQFTNSLIWGNTGGIADLELHARIQSSNNRYLTATAPFIQFSPNNSALPVLTVDALYRPTVGSLLRDASQGVGTKDVYGQPREINGYVDIGAAEGL